jgi:hypothetical protein
MLLDDRERGKHVKTILSLDSSLEDSDLKRNNADERKPTTHFMHQRPGYVRYFKERWMSTNEI